MQENTYWNDEIPLRWKNLGRASFPQKNSSQSVTDFSRKDFLLCKYNIKPTLYICSSLQTVNWRNYQQLDEWSVSETQKHSLTHYYTKAPINFVTVPN